MGKLLKLVLFFIICAIVFWLLIPILNIFSMLAKISLVMAGFVFLVFIFKKMFF